VRILDNVLRAYTILLLILMYVPIALMVVFSFNPIKSLAKLAGFSLRWYQALMGNRIVWEAFFNSLWVAAVVTLVSIVLGLLMANAVVRFRFSGKPLVDMLIYVPVIIPEITESLSLLMMYVFINFPLGAWSVIIGHAAFSISYGVVVLRARLAGFDTSVEEAAKTLGANELQTFLKVTMPIMMPGILAASLLAFTISYDDFIKTMFTTGPGFKTLPLIIWFSASKGGVSPELNSLSTFAISISLLFAFARMKISGIKW